MTSRLGTGKPLTFFFTVYVGGDGMLRCGIPELGVCGWVGGGEGGGWYPLLYAVYNGCFDSGVRN